MSSFTPAPPAPLLTGTALFWCRSCGGDASPGEDRCRWCGVPLVGPDPGKPRVGHVVAIPGRLLTKKAVAVEEQPGTVVVLVKPGETVQLPTEQFDTLRRVAVPGPPVVGATGRLWAANRARLTGTVKGKWPSETVNAVAAALATANLASRRAAALDAIALGIPDWPERLELTGSEVVWYRVWAAGMAHDPAVLLDWLALLPPQGYLARIPLLLRHAAGLLQNPALHERARAALAPFLDTSPDARALSLALQPTPAPDIIAATVEYANVVAAGAAPARPELPTVAAAIAARERLPVIPLTPSPCLRALDAFLAGESGAVLDAATDVLAPLPGVLLDALIARGALRLMPQRSPWSPALTAYLRCRLDPGGADPEQLRATGFVAEQARRAYVAGDDAGLAALRDDDPDVRHYRALRRYRVDGNIDDPEGLRPQARAVFEAVATVRSGTAEGREGALSVLATDPSCWPLVEDLAFRAGIELDVALRTRYPDFAAWQDLCHMQRMVFEERFTEVSAEGRRVAASCQLGSMRDEALNMVAFAEWQLGRSGEALRVLREALGGQFTTGLVVNAALVAADQGCLPSFEYLAQAMRLASDPRVRQGALGRAIAVWQADDKVTGYPAELAAMVREGLVTPQADDEFFRTLLVLSSNVDTEWLADGHVVATGPDQEAAVRYYRVRARTFSARYPETFHDLGAAMVGLWHAVPRPGWAERERTWLTELLMELVHKPFGEAVGVVPLVEALNSGAVLDLPERLILTVQAGAHESAARDEARSTISPDQEQRLLFTPVREYRSRRTELPEGVREVVAEELGRCVIVAALSAMSNTEREMQAFSAQWDALVARERWDYQNTATIVAHERELLDHLDVHIDRCARYLELLDNLPLDDAALELRGTMTTNVHGWTAESRRLRGLL